MSILYRAFGMLLYFLYTLVGNYGVAIILFTVICKLVLLPLNIKSTKSMRETQALLPMTQYLQKKYKNNPEKLNQETSKLYQVYHVNPMGGCLPLLIQLPIIYALFGALRNPTEYVFVGTKASAVNQSFLWIPNLSQPDPYYILPILCVIFTFLTQKFTMSMNKMAENEQTQSSQRMMLYLMPLLIGFMALSLPAGVAIYWVVQNVFTFLQQFIMMRKPVETIPIMEAEKKLEEYSRNKRKEIKAVRQTGTDRMNQYMGSTNKKNKEHSTPSVKMTPASKRNVRKTITKIPKR